MWRMNTAPNIQVCLSINSKRYCAAISSPLQQLQGLIKHPLIHMISPVMMRKTERQRMWPRGHQDEVITQPAYWLPAGSIWIHHLKHQWPGGKLIQISMITTPTKWRLAVHLGYRISPTGGDNRRKRTQSTPISPMWQVTYSLSYYILSEWRPVFPLAEMLSAGGSQKPQARPFAKKSL